MRAKSLTVFLTASLIAFVVPTACLAQTPGATNETYGLPAQYSATAFGQAGTAAGKSFGLTTARALAATLKDKGQDALVSALGKTKDKGRVAPTGSVGTGFRFVRIRPNKDGGQHIVLATDRPISFGELYNMTRSTQYKIGIVVLDVDKDGKGTGTFAPLCKVKFNKNNRLEIENFGQKPFRLANVFRQK
jgi:hypothetical protein